MVCTRKGEDEVGEEKRGGLLKKVINNLKEDTLVILLIQNKDQVKVQKYCWTNLYFTLLLISYEMERGIRWFSTSFGPFDNPPFKLSN